MIAGVVQRSQQLRSWSVHVHRLDPSFVPSANLTTDFVDVEVELFVKHVASPARRQRCPCLIFTASEITT